MVVAANKMDTPEAQDNYEEITADPEYDHLTFVPVSAHAEKALKQADEQGVVSYRPGDSDFDVVGDPSADQREGLEAIESFVAEFDGTGVQRALETALFEELGVVPVFPGGANGLGNERGEVLPDCFLLPEGATTEDFAYHVHSDIGDGFLHGIDCRSERQVGADHELDDRDVIAIVSTN
jgi:ribosome-binding ATPase YchF (GTP1/OBG family)